MTGRQRVLTTLDRRKPDCMPLDIGGTDCTSILAMRDEFWRQKRG